MTLSIRHQWALRQIECSLRRSDPKFVMMMSAFGAVALDGKMPQHERLGPGRRRGVLVVAGLATRLMLLCMAAAALSSTATSWLAAEVAAVLRTGRDVRQAADAGARGSSGADHRTLF